MDSNYDESGSSSCAKRRLHRPKAAKPFKHNLSASPELIGPGKANARANEFLQQLLKDAKKNENHIADCHEDLHNCPILKSYSQTVHKGFANYLNKQNKPKPLRQSFNQIHSVDGISDSGTSDATVKTEKFRSKSTNTLMTRPTRSLQLRMQNSRHLMETKADEKRIDLLAPYKLKKSVKKIQTSDFGPKTRMYSTYSDRKTTTSMTQQPGETVADTGSTREKRLGLKSAYSTEPLRTTPIHNKVKLEKSKTFVICEGIKREGEKCFSKFDESDSDFDEELRHFKPITHQDSFCLIKRSSKNWKTNSEESNSIMKQKCKTTSKDIDSDGSGVDKKVKFYDVQKKIMNNKTSRRKLMIETTKSFKSNEMFQKHFQQLKGKSVLFRNGFNCETPEVTKERYEAEMLGVVPVMPIIRRKGRYSDC